ncbi:MAG: hypothetical protein JJE34_08685 [Alphaproteobacteria bacterium]|nr:hypothetical protein [Alphaproteobacteria bacterium]
MEKRTEAIDKGTALYSDLLRLIDGLEIRADLRSRLSGGCYTAALDIHAGIILLCSKEVYVAAFALLRPLWEAYIRGTWLLNCADDNWVQRFFDGDDPPQIGQMITVIEKLPEFDAKVLSNAHNSDWSHLNGLTHIGAPLVIRCNSAEHLENNFDANEIVKAVHHAGSIAILAALGIAKLGNDGGLQQRLLATAKKFNGE